MLLSCCVTLGKLLSLSVLQFYHQASLLMVESLPAVRETWVPSLGWEDPLCHLTISSSVVLSSPAFKLSQHQGLFK